MVGVIEPQAAIFFSMSDALILWPDDPVAANRTASQGLQSPDVALASLIDAAPQAARMALRVGDPRTSSARSRASLGVARRCSGPIRELQAAGWRR